MAMSVTPNSLAKIESLLHSWLSKKSASNSMLQSLIGKLMFISKCVRQSRIFMSRLLTQLWTLKHSHHHFTLRSESKNDLQWWCWFLRIFNGVTPLYKVVWFFTGRSRRHRCLFVGMRRFIRLPVFSFCGPTVRFRFISRY